MTKFEETEQYWDNFFTNISKMDEAQLNDFMLHLDEAAILNSLKRQLSKIRKTISKQEKVIKDIKRLIENDKSNPSADKLLSGLTSQFEKAQTNKKNLEKLLPLMDQIAEYIDENSTTLGDKKADANYDVSPDDKSSESRVNMSSKDLSGVMRAEKKNTKDALGYKGL